MLSNFAKKELEGYPEKLPVSLERFLLILNRWGIPTGAIL
jgi:hypothetical protein